MTNWVVRLTTHQLRMANIWLAIACVYFPTINVKYMCLSLMTHILFGLQLFRVTLAASLRALFSFSILWSADTQIIGSASKPHLGKLCGTCGGMLHCTVIRKRKCETHETWKSCNYCLRAVLRLRKVYCVLVVKDISFTVGSAYWTLCRDVK